MQIAVDSEIGPLRRVVVHRPGSEVVRMTQFELERLLFDDILAADLAGHEHDVMGEILASEGAEVLEVQELLARAVARAPSEQVERLVRRVCHRAGCADIAGIVADRAPEELAATLVGGAFWDELEGAPLTLSRLRARLEGRAEAALPPAPNLMFTRDPCMTIYDRVLVGRMATDARAREPLLVRFALEHGLDEPPALMFDEPDWERHPSSRAIEGGDVLVLSKRFLLIGCSERTTPQTLERVAHDVLFPIFPELKRVYAVLMPPRRSVMHLDTILTQIDQGLFLGFAPMIAEGRDIHVVQLERGLPPRLLEETTVLDVLRDELGASVRLVPCGGDDPLFQQREQWTDGANAFCLRPGAILLYGRNVRTVEALVHHGFVPVEVAAVHGADERAARLAEGRKHPRVVYTFTGSELSRARGGARCMTMPLQRGPLP